MQNTTPFVEVLEAADRLSVEEQEALVDIVHRRMIEKRRAELVKDIQDAQREFEAGGCRPVSPSELITLQRFAKPNRLKSSAHSAIL